ncbi:MAG TPA: sulfite exporter TauE/SafE family protein [Nocardioidaceae bacterium]|nr:sulfite exporter TauE/SafE family protein [Nocardioidaceae bacterium]
MILGIEVWVVVVLAATLTLGAAIQGLVGLGLALVAAPVTTLIAPELMPDLLLWLAFVMPFVTLVREHHRIDWRGLGWALPARVPGTVVGVLFVGWFSAREMGIAVGLMVLLSVILTVGSLRLPVSRRNLLAAGFVSGITGTATSIGGPPMAILYQHREPLQIRTTLAIYFMLGAAFSLVGLGVAGSLTLEPLLLAVLLLPCLVVGFLVSRVLHRYLPSHHVRPGVLLVCALSAVVLLVRSLFA